ncbi:MAG: RDD family protein [bacterium]|nr:RDD family protein [bacterium]
MDQIEIQGTQYPLATLGQRLLAQIVDGAVYFGIVLLTVLPFGFKGGVVGALIAGLYLLFQDGLAGGQSFGKRLTKTAVIDARTGQWCSFWQSFVRNLLLSLLNFIDWIFIFGAKRQRLGDLAAGTVVIQIGPDV